VRRHPAVILFAAVLAGCPAVAQESALVITGGTLIDGNGGEPISDAVIVIEGNRIAEVADSRGVPVFTRAYGPSFGPRDAAPLGSTNLPHSAGVPWAITRNPSEDAQGDELEMYAEIDPERAESLIRLLVESGTALTPTFKIEYPGYPRDWKRFEEDDRRFFAEADPNLLAYYPPDRMMAALDRYTNTSGTAQGAAGPLGRRHVQQRLPDRGLQRLTAPDNRWAGAG